MTRSAKDRAKGLAALAGLLAVLIGPPVALAHFVGWPLPVAVPGLDELTAAARSGIDDMVVIKVLAVLAWLCWLQIALAATVEMAALAHGHAARRAPVFAGVQLGVGRLVATAALVLTSLGPPRMAVTSLPVARLAAIVAEPAPRGVAPGPVVMSSPRLVAAASESAPAAGSGHSYVVKRNDSWWAIAERTLGDGQRWKELREANLGRTMPDGMVIG
ncbi:MAG: LysM peptidoglycan-binding domain-containing protein, partial [Acidimicrobiales bacterium]